MSDESLVLRVSVDDDASGPFRRIVERADDVEDAFRKLDRAAGRSGRSGLAGVASQAGVAEQSVRRSERAVRAHRDELGRFAGQAERTGRRFGSGFTAPVTQGTGRIRAGRDELGRFAGQAERTGRRFSLSFAAPVTQGTGRVRTALTGLLPLVSRAGLVFAAAAAAGGLFTARTIGDLQNIERIGAQTDAAIRSTGGVANVTRTDIDRLANSLERLSGTEAETITAGANMLLTFTKVRNEIGAGNNVFDRATALGLDMSIALGQDAAGSALQLGKALNDPIQGVTALRRAGVSFTAQQLEQIKVMQESGDILGAQKLVLAELEIQFGGSAAALGATDTGKLRRIANTVGNIAEALVGGFLPQMSGGIDWILGQLGDLEARAPEIGGRIGDAVADLGARLGNAFGQRTFGGGLVAFFGPSNARHVRLFLGVVEDVGAVLTDLLLPTIQDLGAALPLFIGPLGLARLLLGFLADNAETLQPFLGPLLAGFLAFRSVVAVVNLVTGAMAALNLVLALNPFVLIVAAAAALAAGFWLLYQNSETFRNYFDTSFFPSLKEGFLYFASFGLFAIRAIVNGFLWMAEQIVSTAADAFGWVPGLGDKLRTAETAVADFRQGFNEQMQGLQTRVDLALQTNDALAKVEQVRRALAGLEDYGRFNVGFDQRSGVTVRRGQAGRVAERFLGGPVWAGLTYLSGEQGPELLSTRTGVELLGGRGPEVRTAREPGVVIPAAQTGRMLAGAGPTTVNLTVPITTGGGDWVDRAALAAAVRAEIGRQQRNRAERTTRHQR